KGVGLLRPMPQPLVKEPSRKAAARRATTQTAAVPLDQAPPKTDKEAATPSPPPPLIPTEPNPETLKSHILRRLPPVAEALRTNRLQELYRVNALERMTAQHLHKRLDMPTLAAYMHENFAAWRNQGFALEHFPSLRSNQYLRQQFLANTTSQLVALAAEAGVVECPPLELTRPYIFNDFEVTVVGLLRYGLEAPEIAQIFSVPRITDYTVRLFDNLVARLPADEPRPQKQNGPWFVYTARRLGLLAFTKSEARYFAKGTLKKFMGFLFDEQRNFYPLRDA
ncbi:MAG TPA: hypothetical protein VFT58_02130, partial [Nitrososphaera sp.]|nr:hypothetical protein [Nitrososphaera sp.]